MDNPTTDNGQRHSFSDARYGCAAPKLTIKLIKNFTAYQRVRGSQDRFHKVVAVPSVRRSVRQAAGDGGVEIGCCVDVVIHDHVAAGVVGHDGRGGGGNGARKVDEDGGRRSALLRRSGRGWPIAAGW